MEVARNQWIHSRDRQCGISYTTLAIRAAFRVLCPICRRHWLPPLRLPYDSVLSALHSTDFLYPSKLSSNLSFTSLTFSLSLSLDTINSLIHYNMMLTRVSRVAINGQVSHYYKWTLFSHQLCTRLTFALFRRKMYPSWLDLSPPTL